MAVTPGRSPRRCRRLESPPIHRPRQELFASGAVVGSCSRRGQRKAAAAVRSASQAVDRLCSQGAAGRGLSAGALDVLVRLGAAPDEGLSIGELARAGGVSSRNITGLVDTLERDHLVKRVQDRHDRRSVRVRTV
ncbi:MarR family transcriptional regulator [Streptomyces sp. N2A]|uniref:MarR family winged helix-turn-helix transcriptional regulator n=1 Tax=Streptomyces sp. N2A TaxID=3073936 RepID=UPI00286FEB02|nr:MarR family transcriptional regulator [Streptomyces sp. N2A]